MSASGWNQHNIKLYKGPIGPMPQSSRKRAAPGASPITQQQMQSSLNQNNHSTPTAPTDQYAAWNQETSINGASSYPDPSSNFDPNLYTGLASQFSTPETSNQLARRPVQQQLLTLAQYNSGGNEPWPGPVQGTQRPQEEEDWNADENELAQRALEAKKERKSIPPFVQKLSR